MTPKVISNLLTLLAASLLLAGCWNEKSDVSSNSAATRVASPRVTKQATEAVDPAVEKSPPVYVYNPAGKRDPFETLLMIRKPVDDANEPRTPLQEFELGQFRLAGIIVGKDDPVAMVMAPGGKSYILKKGVKIGKNAGTVMDIQKDGVLVEERFYDFSGEFRKSIQKIELPEREGV
ncbi:MAG: pilus assembly protein PilP [Syntrophotaleaceae bacterium]